DGSQRTVNRALPRRPARGGCDGEQRHGRDHTELRDGWQVGIAAHPVPALLRDCLNRRVRFGHEWRGPGSLDSAFWARLAQTGLAGDLPAGLLVGPLLADAL